jgi:hypothetical protein
VYFYNEIPIRIEGIIDLCVYINKRKTKNEKKNKMDKTEGFNQNRPKDLPYLEEVKKVGRFLCCFPWSSC